MLIKRIPNFTRVLGQSQGYLGLPIRDEFTNMPDGRLVPMMVSAWEFTPIEMMHVANGATLYLKVLGTEHPPVMMEVKREIFGA